MSFYVKIIVVVVSVDMRIRAFTMNFMVLDRWFVVSPTLMVWHWLSFLCLLSLLLLFLRRWRWL